MTTLHTPPPDATPTSSLSSMQKKVADRLSQLGSRIRRQIALDGFARSLCVLLGLLALSIVLDWWLELSRPIRIVYWLVTLAAAAHFLYHYALKPLSRKFGPIDLAQAIDNASGAQGDAKVAPRVATVLQLPDMLGDETATSSNMIHSAVSRSYDSLAQEKFERHLNTSHMTACLAAVAGAILIPLGLAMLMQFAANGAFGTWASRWLMLTDTPYVRNTEITVLGLDDEGRFVIPKGEAATLRVRVSTRNGDEVRDVEVTTRPEGGRKRSEAMDRFEQSDYRFELAGTQVPIRATVRSGDNDAEFEIIPVDRPSGTIQLFYTHPADGVRRELRFDGTDGGLSLLDLNAVELVITANVPIQTARYTDDIPEEERPGAIEPYGDDGTQFVIRWNHTKRERFRVELVSEQAGLVSQPLAISVGLKSDRAPRVRIQSTGVGTRITPNALIPLSADAKDDLGLTDLNIQVVRNRPGEEAAPDAFGPVSLFSARRGEDGNFIGDLPKTANGDHGLEIEEYGVRPTDVVRITGVGIDDRYTGPQQGSSTILTYRIVTHEDLAREIKARQEMSRNTFRQAMEACRDNQTEPAQPESGASAAALARRFRAQQREVWNVHNAIAASAEEMRLNRLAGTREEGSRAHELIHQDVLTPMANLHRGLMTTQRDALERAGGASPEQLAALAQQQQEVVDEMNRILSAMDKWASMIDLINQLNEIIGTQRGLRDTLEELFNNQLDDGLGDDLSDDLGDQFD
ncbi:MAG: hypothetical protein ACIAXF_09165 [Phycisphaerales bacterium JB063]